MYTRRGMRGFQPGPDSAGGVSSPCGMSDWVAPSAQCLAFLQTFDPTNWVYVAAQAAFTSGQAAIDSSAGYVGGLPAVAAVDPATGQALTQAASLAVASLVSDVADSVPTASNALCAGFQAGTGITCTQLLIGAVLIGGIALYVAAKR